MKSRALRLTLFTVFAGMLAGVAYVLWHAHARETTGLASSRTFLDGVRATSRSLLELKSAQPGYVAAGQGEEFWFARVDHFVEKTREGFASIEAAAAGTAARSDVQSAIAAFDDFLQMDRRARNYARNGQRLLASDLVFSDGIDKIDAALAALARAEEEQVGTAATLEWEARRTQLMAIAAGAAGALLVALALVPLPPLPAASVPPAAPSTRGAADPPRLNPADRLRPSAPASPEPTMPPSPPAVTATARAPDAPPPPLASPPPAPTAHSHVDLPAIAALCSDLARVLDMQALPAALGRAAALLDAPGIVLWIADPDRRELAPILAHGYPPQVLARMGTIDRDAENVTAAAFRTGLLQTVTSNGTSNGAIAAPLIAPGGTIGVMAAEVLHGAEREEAIRAAAVIVAAQLATLMGPPARSNAEAANA